MLYNLILVLTLSNGVTETHIIDDALTRSECVERMLVMNREFDTRVSNPVKFDSEFMCEYTEKK